MSNKYTIEYLPITQQDLEEIFSYITKDSPKAAQKFIDDIDEKISMLIKFPFTGTIPRNERLEKLGYRMLIVNQYIIFYVVKEDIIEIRRIFHGHRRFDFLL